jgi:endogenous inhibitor of DNA gyrase (YacG/DUF329 family)
VNPPPRRSRGTRDGATAARPEKRLRCPICGKPASKDDRPFCSSACADIDLGRWLAGRYAVPGEPVGAKPEDAELDEDAEP